MRSFTATWIAFGVMALVLVAGPLQAADSGIGTWIRRVDPTFPQAKTGRGLTMTVEAWGNGGRKLTYRINSPSGGGLVTTVESPMDGTDVPVLVNGKPSGETMGIKRVDGHHTLTVLKFKGKQYGISRGALSADFNTLTVENEITFAEGGRQPGKATDIWVRK